MERGEGYELGGGARFARYALIRGMGGVARTETDCTRLLTSHYSVRLRHHHIGGVRLFSYYFVAEPVCVTSPRAG